MSFINCKVIGEGISYEVYSRQAPSVNRGHPEFVMSRSELIAFALNPEKWLLSKESPDTVATEWGRLTECLEMNPSGFDKLFAVTPETYPVTPKKKDDPIEQKPWTTRAYFCSDWEGQKVKEGKTVISSDVKSKAGEAVKCCRAYQPRVELVACSRKQVMVIGLWQDKATEIAIPLRCLLDLVPDKENPTWGKVLADSKTARNGDPSNFSRVIDDEGYDIQAALSMDLYLAATGEDRTDWVYPLSENTEPWHVVKPMPALTAEFLAWGRIKYQSALAYYAQCLSKNEWPSYRMAGVPFGSTQLIGPDELWTYKKTAGQGSISEHE